MQDDPALWSGLGPQFYNWVVAHAVFLGGMAALMALVAVALKSFFFLSAQ